VLVYHGTFSYPPNREALRLFAEVLLPGLELQGLSAHLLAVGKNPPAISPHPRIHLTGSAERVAPWLKSADLAVIPRPAKSVLKAQPGSAQQAVASRFTRSLKNWPGNWGSTYRIAGPGPAPSAA